MTDEADGFIDGYRSYLNRRDELANVVLNAHFDVEAALDTFFEMMFFNPQHLQGARLTYLQKTLIAQAYNELSSERPEWRLMLVLNQLRNSIAHGDTGKARHTKISELRKTLSGIGISSFRDSIGSMDDKDVVVHAAAMASGFLFIMEEQLAKIRRPKEDAGG